MNTITYFLRHYVLHILIICSLFSLHCIKSSKQELKNTGINALLLVPKNFGANYFLMKDVIEEYGWNVTHTGVLDTIPPCPWLASHQPIPPIIPDIKISEINIYDYQCLIIPPTTGNAAPVPNPAGDLIESKEAQKLIFDANQANLPIFAMCAGSRVLAAANIVNGIKMVGSPKFEQGYRAAGAIYVGRPKNDNPPTFDENLITAARGQYYNYANVMAIATTIEYYQKKGTKPTQKSNYISTLNSDYNNDKIDWIRTYDGPGADAGRSICVTKDGGFLIVGYSFAPGSKDSDIWVLKTNSEGEIIWKNIFGGTGTEYANDCCCIEDGFLITGYTTSFGSGSKDVFDKIRSKW